MAKIDFFEENIFYEIPHLENDLDLLRAAKACIALHQAEQGEDLSRFQRDSLALEKVSEESLNHILNSDGDVHGITTNPEISNCLKFNIDSVQDSLKKESVHLFRKALDYVVIIKARSLFKATHEISITNSGHFLYPPGGFMSWHTNSKSAGWRLYINYAEEPGKSFFRYRDPKTEKVVTSWDKKWNFRLFKIDPKKPFWHAVYSETNRYSFGYRIMIDWNQPLYKRAWFRTKYLLHSVLTGNN